MRTIKEVRDIVTQLGILEEYSAQLQSLNADVNIVLQKGTSWINDKEDNQTYMEFKEYLNRETSECIRRCYSIGESSLIKERVKQSTESETIDESCSTLRNDKDCTDLIKQIKVITTQEASHSEMFKTLQQKQIDLEKQIKTLLKQRKETSEKINEKFGEILEELHAASKFMSHLQTQTDDLSNALNKINVELNENNEKMKTLFNKRNENNQKVETLFKERNENNQKVETLFKERNENNEKYKEQDKKIEDVFDKVKVCLQKVNLFEPDRLERLNNEIKRLTEELTKSDENLKIKDKEIIQLKDQTGKTNTDLEKYKQNIRSVKELIEVSGESVGGQSCFNCRNVHQFCFHCWKNKILEKLHK